MIKIEYFGKIFTIPVKYHFISTDKDGAIRLHIHKPKTREEYWINFLNSKDMILTIATIDYDGDWKESLKSIQDIIVK